MVKPEPIQDAVRPEPLRRAVGEPNREQRRQRDRENRQKLTKERDAP